MLHLHINFCKLLLFWACTANENMHFYLHSAVVNVKGEGAEINKRARRQQVTCGLVCIMDCVWQSAMSNILPGCQACYRCQPDSSCSSTSWGGPNNEINISLPDGESSCLFLQHINHWTFVLQFIY